MNKNSEAILIFCSHLCISASIRPLEPKEWSELASRLVAEGLEPQHLLEFTSNDFKEKLGLDELSADRMVRLLERSGSMSFELSKYENMGIFALTRADKNYPKQLKQKLGNQCPPIFYYAGDINLLDKRYVGFVGSRTVDEEDMKFTNHTVAKIVAKGYGVVTGGAKGVDTAAADAALANGGFVIEYLSDSMMQKMKKIDVVKSIADGKRLLLSVTVPTAGFNVGFAMMRNKFIYAQSDATVIVKSEKGKGGTWAGATENLKKGWCTEYCRQCPSKGNLELIKLGAVPIDDDWNGEIEIKEFEPQKKEAPTQLPPNADVAVQISLFD